ncbi:hypothetical protein EYF80_031649 [Liparis tanakae]|uniref:Uncharacterized protein n=1 Tax=Liparis tanakae TaxID=230148 RepID=A0A4Z2GX72_9TELE|nr:hypothetical protein EYF80_031649 [Liparis tanakae]
MRSAYEAGGTKKGAGSLGRRPGPRPEAGCRKQGQGVRTQDRLQTQPGPMNPMRREGNKS